MTALEEVVSGVKDTAGCPTMEPEEAELARLFSVPSEFKDTGDTKVPLDALDREHSPATVEKKVPETGATATELAPKLCRDVVLVFKLFELPRDVAGNTRLPSLSGSCLIGTAKLPGAGEEIDDISILAGKVAVKISFPW